MGLLKQMNNIDIQKAFNVTDVTSSIMDQRLQSCVEEYFRTNKSKSRLQDLNLPFVIVNKLTRAIFGDFTAVVADDFYKDFFKKVDNKKKEIMSKSLYSGSVILKPFIDSFNTLDLIVCPRTNYMPCGRNSDGTLSEVILSETKTVGPDFYTLLEKRKTVPGGTEVIYKLFKSSVPGSLGKQVKLSTLYPDLTDSFVLAVPNLGLIELKTPLLNDVDGSAEGVPVFEPALELIQLINENEAQLSDEFKLGQSRVFVDEAAFRKDDDGNLILTDKVFTPMYDGGEAMTIFNPTLREQSYLTRKNAYLRAIEDIIGLQRGILSDASEADKTATEIGQSAAVYNLTLIDFQDSFNTAIQSLFSIVGKIGGLYNVAKAKEYTGEVSIDFGDGVLYDRDKVFSEQLQLVAAGLLKAEKFIAWYFSIDDTTPEGQAQVASLMPELTQLLKREDDE
jgi:A118 family predicted phage portal protein